jgi:hypothetical protein
MQCNYIYFPYFLCSINSPYLCTNSKEVREEQSLSLKKSSSISEEPLTSAFQMILISWPWLKEVQEEARFSLVIDDSHSLGICEKNGGGINTTIDNHDHIEFVTLSSFGKALGRRCFHEK